MAQPTSLYRDISPPRKRKKAAPHNPPEGQGASTGAKKSGNDDCDHGDQTPAAIEAGETQIDDHLEYFVTKLSEVSLFNPDRTLSTGAFRNLYKRNQHTHGHHFVIHQHDHPISGVHYDLRIQFSRTSSISFAIPYGMPGNPNSVRPNRMAIETRVHNLWNHLIESASHATGSLLIWDTGEYEVLPRQESKLKSTDDELSGDEIDAVVDGRSQSEQLTDAFKRRRIRLRLHGSRLPPNYTVSLWLPSSNDRDGQPRKPKRKRRRKDPTNAANNVTLRSSDTEPEDEVTATQQSEDRDLQHKEEDAGLASDEDEDETIRANNAYTGATNTIGSIHQRHWFLTLDRKNSGCRRVRSGADEGRWIAEWEPFVVRGRDYERSVVTGRNADEVMNDGGVERFEGRKMWQPIVH